MGFHNFSSASRDGKDVFGAERPGYPATKVRSEAIGKWIAFMKGEGIKRVCCLLTDVQLAYYPDGLLDAYRDAFGKDNVCSAPIEDFHLCDAEMVHGTILPFLKDSQQRHGPVVVHCSGGIGRTGHVLAAWLVYYRNLSPDEALSAVIETGRDPFEAVGPHATKAELYQLLEGCRTA